MDAVILVFLGISFYFWNEDSADLESTFKIIDPALARVQQSLFRVNVWTFSVTFAYATTACSKTVIQPV